VSNKRNPGLGPAHRNSSLSGVGRGGAEEVEVRRGPSFIPPAFGTTRPRDLRDHDRTRSFGRGASGPGRLQPPSSCVARTIRENQDLPGPRRIQMATRDFSAAEIRRPGNYLITYDP